MGLFNKKKKEENSSFSESYPSLPELPKLPEFPRLEEPKERNQLPSYPNNSLGKEFSQNAIKDAISGEKEGEEVDVDDFATDDEEQMMHEPSDNELPDFDDEEPLEDNEKLKKSIGIKRIDPVFIRIDKFEESLKTFDKAKKDISEIESMLGNLKKIKDEEEKELIKWEREMQRVKGQIAKVDNDIFSKIE